MNAHTWSTAVGMRWRSPEGWPSQHSGARYCGGRRPAAVRMFVAWAANKITEIDL
jgi:hypothetical protein